MTTYLKQAADLDQNDQLKRFKQAFYHGDEPLIYLDGNSLGMLPMATLQKIQHTIEEQWGKRLIRSWNESWIGLQKRLAAKIANIVGARQDEIFIGDSTSVNFYKLAFAALNQQQGKHQIISDTLNFPSDLYIIQGLIANTFQNHQLTLLESKDGMTIGLEQIEARLNHDTALLSFSHVLFRSAFKYPMLEVNRLAAEFDASVIWDLSHAAGAVPLSLNSDEAHMAVGCTYKYLNGGPGAPAFLYVSKAMQEKIQSPVWGWFGHAQPFSFDLAYHALPGIEGFAAGTPPILSLAALEGGLDVLLEAGPDRLYQKASQMTRFLQQMVEEELSKYGFSMASPADHNQRGSHIVLHHSEGFRITKALIEPDGKAPVIIPDFRPPSFIRIGMAPLYNSFMDLYLLIERLIQIVEHEEYNLFDHERATIT